MKIQLSVLFFLFSIVVFAQKHILILKSKHASFFKEIKEDRELKLKRKKEKHFLDGLRCKIQRRLLLTKKLFYWPILSK